MTVYTGAVEKTLDITLKVRYNTLVMGTYDPQSGDSYRLLFNRDENRQEVASRIGEEILAWFDELAEQYDRGE